MSLANEKNPLHASALRLRDLTVGRHIIAFNIDLGIMGEYIVMSRPFVGDGMFGRTTMVSLRNTQTGLADSHYTEDLGVTMYLSDDEQPNNYWNSVNFTIDHRKRHLLPKPLIDSGTGIDDLETRILRRILTDSSEEYAADVEAMDRLWRALEAME